MKRLTSAQTKSLLVSLRAPVSFWQSSAKHRIQILALLGESHEPAVIPDVVSLLLDSNRNVKQAAADAIRLLASALEPSDYAWLDRLMRERFSYRWSANDPWVALKLRGVARLQGLGESSVVAVGMATFHWNGYVRQEALRQLSLAQDGTELPFLLLRLNDWVKPVRLTADLLIRERLISKYADTFVKSLSLLRRLSLTQRGHYSQIKEGIGWLLRSEEGNKALEKGLSAKGLEIKRACYDFAFQFGCVSPLLLVEKALADRDPAVRALAISKAELIPATDAVKHSLERALTDSYAPVRRKALQIFVEKFPSESYPWLQGSLLDAHPSVRNYAQFMMVKVPGIQLREFYRNMLADSNRTSLSAAISGLGETGIPGDAPLILAHVSLPTPRIRRVALRAIARLQLEEHAAVFQQHLVDESPAVSREAMKALSKLVHILTGEELWRVFSNYSLTHVQRHVLFLIARLSKWESIAYLVGAAAADNEQVASLAQHYIQRWIARFNSSFTSPTDSQLLRLSEAINKYGILLSREVLDEIKFDIPR